MDAVQRLFLCAHIEFQATNFHESINGAMHYLYISHILCFVTLSKLMEDKKDVAGPDICLEFKLFILLVNWILNRVHFISHDIVKVYEA